MMNRPCAEQYRLTPQEKRVLALLLQGHHKKTAADVMESVTNLNGKVASPTRSFEHQADPPVDAEPDIRIRIEELLGPSPVPVDEIVRQSGAEPGAVQLILLELDLAGRLDRPAGGKVSLIGSA